MTAFGNAGIRLSDLSVHPRLGAMLLMSQRLHASELGCIVAALISERDIFRGPAPSADLSLRVYALAEAHAGQSPPMSPWMRPDSGLSFHMHSDCIVDQPLQQFVSLFALLSQRTSGQACWTTCNADQVSSHKTMRDTSSFYYALAWHALHLHHVRG